MKKGSKSNDKDDDMPVGPLRVVPDFLPPPHQLVVPSDFVKVTIQLDQASVAFFKMQAKRHRTKYQRMMREVLRRYVEHHRGHAA